MSFLLKFVIAVVCLIAIFVFLSFIAFAFSIGASTGEGLGLVVVGILFIACLVGCIVGVNKLNKKYK